MENISQLIVVTQPPSLIFTLIFFSRKSSESKMSGLFLLTISCVCFELGASSFCFSYAMTYFTVYCSVILAVD